MSLPSAAAEPGSGAALPGSDPETVPLGQRLREALPVFVIALLWRASCLMGYLTDPAALTLRFDERSYHALGMRLARGDLLLDPEPLVLSPLYTAFVGAVYATFGFEPSAVLWLQMLLGASMVGGVYLLARRLASRGAATFAALLYAFTGPAVFYEHFLLPDLLTAATVLGTLRAWWMMRERGRTRDAVGAGLWLGVATLARPNAALLLPLLAWDAARSAPDGTSAARARRAAAVTLTLAMVVAPVTLRNGLHGGQLTPVTASGPLHFYVGNARTSDGTYHSPSAWPDSSPGLLDQRDAADKAAEAHTGRPQRSDETNRYWVRKALTDIAEQPLTWLGVELQKLGHLLRGREETDARSYAFERRWVAGLRAPWVPNGSVVIVLGLAGLWLLPRRRHPAGLAFVSLGLVLPVGTALLFYVVGRYRLPWYPVLAVLTAVTVDTAARCARNAEWARLARPALLLAAALGLANVRLSAGDERPNHYLRGRELYDAYEPLMAAEHFRAAATHPTLRDAALQNAAAALMEGGLLVESEQTLIELLAHREDAGDDAATRRTRNLLESLQEFRTPDLDAPEEP